MERRGLWRKVRQLSTCENKGKRRGIVSCSMHPLLIILLSSFSHVGYSASNSTMIGVVGAENSLQLGLAISKIEHLIRELENEKSKFQSIEEYENEQTRIKRKLDEATQQRFVLRDIADNVELDWDSGQVLVEELMPLPVVSERSAATVKGIRVRISGPDGLIRQMYTFPKQVEIEGEFRISKQMKIVLYRLKVWYGQEQVFSR